MGNYTFTDLKVGMFVERSYTFYEEKIKIFADLVEDQAPIHTDVDFALSKGFSGKIVHGLFVESIISGMMGNEIPGSNSVINSLNMKMHSPVLIGETVDYRMEITALTEAVAAISLSYVGKVGERQIITGKALCSIPKITKK